MEPALTFSCFPDYPSFTCSESGLRPRMSSQFEYRRLAATSLDLAKRTAVLTDKMRLLVMAEGWLSLADRSVDRARNSHRDRDGNRHARAAICGGGNTICRGQDRT